MGYLIDLEDLKFGKLTVLFKVEQSTKADSLWQCKCDCGKFIKVKSYALRAGRVRSCGCATILRLKQMNTKHGMSNSKLYYKWHDLKTRHKAILSPDWLDAKAFIQWALDNGYQEGYKLIRITKLFGFAAGNCKWVPPKEKKGGTK